MTTTVPPQVGMASARVRTITVAAFDARRRVAVGAEILVLVHGLPAGSFTLDAESPTASLEIDDALAPVRLVARFGTSLLTKDLGPDDRLSEFTFPVERPLEFAVAPAEARCPDGTAGRPCVVCAVGGTRVRICV